MIGAGVLVAFGGLPGTGKTTLARRLARHLGATFLRIDTIEQAMTDTLGVPDLRDAGYRLAYRLAEDNLRLGGAVVADSVNPLAVCRDAWRSVAARTGARLHEVELICSDVVEHRRRVEERRGDIPGLRLPTWNDVTQRHYEPWTRAHIAIDTAGRTAEQCLERLLHEIGG